MAGEIRIRKDELDGLYGKLATHVITEAEFVVATAVARYTYGFYNRDHAPIRARAIQDLTGYSVRKSQRLLRSLINKGVLLEFPGGQVKVVGLNPDLRSSGHAFRTELKRRAKEASTRLATRLAETPAFDAAASESMSGYCVTVGDAPMKHSNEALRESSCYTRSLSLRAHAREQTPETRFSYDEKETLNPLLGDKVSEKEALATSATPTRVENPAGQEGKAGSEATAAQAESPVVLLGSQKEEPIKACPAVVAAADPTGELRAAAGEEAFAAWAGRLCKELADIAHWVPCDYRRPTCERVAKEAGEVLLKKLPGMEKPGVYIARFDHTGDRHFVNEDDLFSIKKEILDRHDGALAEQRARAAAADPHTAAFFAEMERVLANFSSIAPELAEAAYDAELDP